jgi:catechol 2,3-dioxygenase-like lactoylglutathione lyase family enzyme
MKARITVITLAVDDLDRAVAFYRDGLGFPTQGIVGREFEHGAVAFFDLDGGLKLGLWPRASLAFDAGLTAGVGLSASTSTSTELSLGHNVNSRGEVDEVMARAVLAGATVVKPAGDTFWGGYAGYFADTDGHLWEVVWNPGLVVDE